MSADQLIKGFDGIPDDFTAMSERLLPTIHAFQTQIAPGPLTMETHLLRTPDIAVVRLKLSVATVSTIVPKPEFVALILPISGEHWVNGVHLAQTRAYLSVNNDGYYARGGSREVITVGLERGRLVNALAALQGCDPDEVHLENCVIDLPLQSFFLLRRHFMSLLEQNLGSVESGDSARSDEIEEDVYGAVVQAYLSGRRDHPAMPSRQGTKTPEKIVRLVEDYFVAAQGMPISLAGLCAAAGVSRNALYCTRLFGHYSMRRRSHTWAGAA